MSHAPRKKATIANIRTLSPNENLLINNPEAKPLGY